MIFDSVQKVYIGNQEVTKALLQNIELYTSAPPFPAGALAFWKLSDLTDSSGNGNNLVNTNSVQFVPGKIGNCAQFNGSNYLSSSTGSALTNDFTISTWVNIDLSQIGPFGVILNISSIADGLQMYVTSNGSILAYQEGIGGIIAQSSSNTVTSNTWNHIVFVRTSGTLTIFVNGAQVATSSTSVSYGSPNFRFGIHYNTTADPVVGFVDATGVWNRALTTQERQTLYNSGNGIEP